MIDSILCFFVEYGDFVLSSVMSIFLGYVAYQQHKTNRDRLKHEFYQKRFEVYQRTLTLYQMLEQGIPDNQTHRHFIESSEAAYFLFPNNREIYDILKRINANSFIIIGFRKSINPHPDSLKDAKENIQALRDISKDVEHLRLQLEPYLNAPHSRFLTFIKSKLSRSTA